MEERVIGSLKASVIGLGCNQFGRKTDSQTAARIVGTAIDVGINFFDTADLYGSGEEQFSRQGRSEEFLGAALRSCRDDVVLATKFGQPMGSDPRDRGGGERWVRLAVEESLRRLQTDRIDLYQLHTPDPETPIAETLGVLNDLVAQGKVREIGCSNFSPDQLREAETAGKALDKRFVSVQNEYSLLCREPESGTLEQCRDTGSAFLPYFPLARGLLTGKYRKGVETPPSSRVASYPRDRPHLGPSEENLAKAERLLDFAEARGHSLLELAFAWLLAHHEVASVIAGATTLEQVRQNAAAAEWHLSISDMSELDVL